MKRVIIVIMIFFIAIDLAILLGIPRAQTFVAASGVTPAIPASSAVPLPSVAQALTKPSMRSDSTEGLARSPPRFLRAQTVGD